MSALGWIFQQILFELLFVHGKTPRWVRKHAFRHTTTYQCTGCGARLKYSGLDGKGPRILNGFGCPNCDEEYDVKTWGWPAFAQYHQMKDEERAS